MRLSRVTCGRSKWRDVERRRTGTVCDSVQGRVDGVPGVDWGTGRRLGSDSK